MHIFVYKLSWICCFFTTRQVTLMILNAFVTVDFTIYRQIAIQSKQEQNKYYFLHGTIEESDSRVTVVTKDGNPKSGKYIMCIFKLNNTDKLNIYSLYMNTLNNLKRIRICCTTCTYVILTIYLHRVNFVALNIRVTKWMAIIELFFQITRRYD